MKYLTPLSRLVITVGIALLASVASAQNTTTAPAPAAASTGPYKVLNTDKVGGMGNWDYVFADTDTRQLYIPRSNRVDVYDLDSLAPLGNISNTTSVHGVATDTKSGHAFCSSNPVVMWDTKTLATIKTIPVNGSPDGILFEPATERVYILSHRTPNVTAIDAISGNVVGTLDLGGQPEQAASDGQGHVYIDLEDQDAIAVVDATAFKLTGNYDISSQGGGPGGLAMDAKNRILFAACHDPATMVILNADTGKIITALPIGTGVDAAEFNPNTLEAFSSQGDGTLTVIKENSPTDFVVEQNVKTKSGARTSTLDTKTNQIYLVTAERMARPPTPPAAPAATASAATPASNTTAAPAATPAASNTTANVATATPPPPPPGPGQRYRGGRGGAMVPGSFTILVVGKS
ncbi:MAG: hypothetical protein ABSH19_05025 [Opitutales bacterium]|jgi:hypothetical protein